MMKNTSNFSWVKKVPLSANSIIIVLILVLLFCLPFIVWGNKYSIGGDDMRLYYIFPEKYLENYALTIVSDNTLGGANTGYYPASQMAPILYVLLFLKNTVPIINTQYLMYGLNYSFAFLFFYLFISIWLKSDSVFTFFSKIVASIFYVFSPLLIGTLYKNQLMSIYLISLMPMSLYFFSYATINRKYYFSILVALLISIFSATLNTLPWSVPILITGIPYLIYLFWSHKKSFVSNTMILIFAFLLLNVHWIFHFTYSNLNADDQGSVSYYSSEEFKTDNIRIISGVSRLLNPLQPVLVSVETNYLRDFKLLDLKNIIFIMVIVLTGIFVKRVKDNTTENIYYIGLLGFLSSWFLFSPNFGKWGPDLFLKIATSLPFATMFRNMFDKFSLPLSFYYSFLLAVGLFVLDKTLNIRKIKMIVLAFVFLVIISNTKYFFFPKTQIDREITTVSGEFNDDYNNLIAYLNKLDNQSRVLWTPMTSPNHVGIEDRYLKGHFYFGLSPLRILAGRGDYAGRFAFMIPSDIFYGDKLVELLKAGKYHEFALNMQKMNARYIVLDHQELPITAKSYFYDSDLKYLNFQNTEFTNELLGNKIKDFGSRYSLYEINQKYISDRLYLTNSYEEFPKKFTGLKYEKVNSYLYKIYIYNLEDSKKLVFLDPYSKYWVLYLNSDGKKNMPFEKGKNVRVNGWANGWEIDPEEIKNNFDSSFYDLDLDGNISLEFSLYFEPQRYNQILYFVTIVSYVISTLIVLIFFTRSLK